MCHIFSDHMNWNQFPVAGHYGTAGYNRGGYPAVNHHNPAAVYSRGGGGMHPGGGFSNPTPNGFPPSGGTFPTSYGTGFGATTGFSSHTNFSSGTTSGSASTFTPRNDRGGYANRGGRGGLPYMGGGRGGSVGGNTHPGMGISQRGGYTPGGPQRGGYTSGPPRFQNNNDLSGGGGGGYNNFNNPRTQYQNRPQQFQQNGSTTIVSQNYSKGSIASVKLTKPKWDNTTLTPFQKDFYTIPPAILNRSPPEVEDYK